ncbi:MAG: NAD(P)/FAD-dependent oxidoreductase [Candidatus Promineifilaceae bacterium]|nr:NAD(P)/FAD-dependent oxidoreductase [Candidatus Promineifilaceae bacterium]
MAQPRTLVIGAGIGGLTTAALLRKAGHTVTVLEAHVYPGGSAGTFYHQRYRFDAGATLAGGFSSGGPHARLAEALQLSWPIEPVDPAWIVHLPDGRQVTQWADRQRWLEEALHHFPRSAPLWRRQERLADIAWDISSRPFPWPPQNLWELIEVARAVRPGTVRALPYLLRKTADLGPLDDPLLDLFLDSQLLIAAQTTANRANALYGSAALDLPRRGVNHVRGGIGALADTLVQWLREHGGEVLFRQKVERIEVRGRRAVAVHTNKRLSLEADYIVVNATPWGLADLLGGEAPSELRREVERRQATWGAFTLYLGLDQAKLPPGISDHHQVIVDAHLPLGEGNSVFISLSSAGDGDRAPAGKRAATLSTHTTVKPWWALRHGDQDAYHARRQAYVERMLAAAERAVPGISQAVELFLPGTPVTFEFYTRRPLGMVGGFPQTSLFDVRGPATGIPNLWLVGDSIFPGQSTAGVTLGGMRVAAAVSRAAERRAVWPVLSSVRDAVTPWQLDSEAG